MTMYAARYPIHLTCIRNDSKLLRAIDATGGLLVLDEVLAGRQYRDFYFEVDKSLEDFWEFLRKEDFYFQVTLQEIPED